MDLIPDIKMTPEKFLSNTNVKCFVHCAFEAKHFFNGNKFDYDGMMKFANDAPSEIGDFIKSSSERCRGATDGIDDKCEAAYALHMCYGLPNQLKN